MGPPQCLMLDTGEAPVPPSWPDTCIQENLVNATRTRQAHACRRHRLGLGNTCSIADTGTSKIEKDSRAHLDDVGIGLGHAGRHCPNAGLGHQLDADLALRRHLHSMAQHTSADDEGRIQVLQSCASGSTDISSAHSMS